MRKDACSRLLNLSCSCLSLSLDFVRRIELTMVKELLSENMDYFLRCKLSVCWPWVIQKKGNIGSLPEKSRGLAGHLFVGVEEATGNPKMRD